jgi:hypothetical protein
MNDSLLQVIYTYTTRRWMMWGMFGGVVLLALFLFGASQSRDPAQAVFVGQLLALPLLVSTIMLAIHAKWQFVHSRARLMPSYAPPHLAVLAMWLGVLLIGYPIVVSQVLQVPTLGLLAFSAVLGATVAWQIQSMRGVVNLLLLLLFMSFYVPSLAEVWLDDGSDYVPFRIAAVVGGVVGIGLWLLRLTRMREEDDDYFLPVQPNGTNASRIEQSESRRWTARMLSRNKLGSWITDRWHDRLASFPPHSEPTRWRLLRYGTMSIPAPVLAFNFLAMACVITGFQYVVFTSMVKDSDSNAMPIMILAQLGGFSVLVIPLVGQFLSIRRPRFAQDLMLPMTREAYVDGLFRSMVETGLWGMLPLLLVVVGAMAKLAPQYFTWVYLVAGLVTIVSLVPLAAAVSFRLVLVSSAMTRTMVLIGMMYPLVGLAIGIFAVTVYVNVALGVVLGALLVGMGYAACRWAREVWLAAELGCL